MRNTTLVFWLNAMPMRRKPAQFVFNLILAAQVPVATKISDLRLTQPPLQPAATDLTFFVAEEAAAADDFGNLRRDHLIPAFVSGGDALEDVP
jgi:hypothetical protein